MQQHELRLNLDIETPRCLEKLHQDFSQRDLLQRPVEYRFAHGADFALERVDARVGRHPAGLDVSCGDPAIVPAEERQEILREIAFVSLGERTHDAEVQSDVFASVGGVGRDEDIAGMHVGVKKSVAKHLSEKYLDSRARKPRKIDSLLDQRLALADRRTQHALHHHHLAGAPVPVDLGDKQQGRVQKIPAKLRAVCRFARKIELVVDRALELGDNLARFQPLAVGPQLLDEHGADLHQAQVLDDGLGDIRP